MLKQNSDYKNLNLQNDVLLKSLPNLKTNYDLHKLTWFQAGGKADFFIKIPDVDSLKEILHIIKSNGLNFFIIGNGSNLIIRDKGFRGIVIKLFKEFNKIVFDNNYAIAGSAVLDKTLSMEALSNGKSNLEFLNTIPGSIGGAIKMNAGCYGSEISNIIEYVKVMDLDGNIKTLGIKDINFSYRSSNIADSLIILEGCFKVIDKDHDTIEKMMLNFLSNREATQPLKVKTGGSTFKNLQQHKAWELIDKSGARNFNIGGAKMSEKHCNFMLNHHNATASDLENLGNLIINTVREKTGFVLEWEVKIIGEE